MKAASKPFLRVKRFFLIVLVKSRPYHNDRYR